MWAQVLAENTSLVARAFLLVSIAPKASVPSWTCRQTSVRGPRQVSVPAKPLEATLVWPSTLEV